jgi:hypothetical protein
MVWPVGDTSASSSRAPACRHWKLPANASAPWRALNRPAISNVGSGAGNVPAPSRSSAVGVQADIAAANAMTAPLAPQHHWTAVPHGQRMRSRAAGSRR